VKTAPDKGGKEKIEEYEKIIAFHDLVISGKHPTINPTPEQVSHVSHTIDMLRCRLLELVVSHLSEVLQ
jgi:hypothetical protein